MVLDEQYLRFLMYKILCYMSMHTGYIVVLNYNIEYQGLRINNFRLNTSNEKNFFINESRQ